MDNPSFFEGGSFTNQPSFPAEIRPDTIGQASIKVIGLGGAGSNAVNRIIELGLFGADFIAANTDHQALQSSLAPTKIQLGPRVTRGLGAGGDPKIGKTAAMESSREIAEALRDADMVFVTAGMGGGTGTGAAPTAAEIAKELGALVIAVVTMPFSFEMSRRAQNASKGVRLLQPHTHTLITVPNDKLLQVVPKDVSLEVAFRFADDVLRQGVQGIVELITQPGMINVDFAHIRQLMTHGGGSLMSIGLGDGPRKAHHALHQAIHHPLLETESLGMANGALVHFTGGESLTLHEVGEAVSELRESLPPEAEVVLGASTDPSMEGRAQVILIVTGVGAKPIHTVQSSSPEITSVVGEDTPVVDFDDIDIPAFLRRRAPVGG